ncbi:unnamed protein product [Alopecurus aequalis]
MASPPGPDSARRPAPLSPFPSHAAGPFLGHQHLSCGGASAEEFEGDEESHAEQEVDHAARSSQQRRTSSSSQGIGLEVMNGENGVMQIEDQERQQCRFHNGGTGENGHASSGGGDEEPGSSTLRETRVEDGYGVIGRREGGPASSYWDLLRAHLSDPLTGILMDDAMILSCGHSYGSKGMQHIYGMKACGKCGQPITENSIRPNLALRLAVQAFRREEESAKTLKRRRDRLEQDKNGNDGPNPTELSRGKGVQYPFAVFDRVIIKGNKRTPERFVGRVAVVTSQCLNGWYVVKTLDNAESVKLQYRSLAKFTDSGGGEPSAVVSNSAQNASWL